MWRDVACSWPTLLKVSTAIAARLLESLSRGRGDQELTAIVWYELHCMPQWQHLAEDIDRKAFQDRTFEQAFPAEREKHLAALGRWRLIGSGPLQAADEFCWNFDLPDRQPSADGKSLGVYLEAAAGLGELGDNKYGFRVLRLMPKLSGAEADIELSQTFKEAQPVSDGAKIMLGGSGRYANFWTIRSTGEHALEGSFSTDQAVMRIDLATGPVDFTTAMIGKSEDVCDQFGNKQARDVRDAFLQALYAERAGARDEGTESITLFEMRHTLRRVAKPQQ